MKAMKRRDLLSLLTLIGSGAAAAEAIPREPDTPQSPNTLSESEVFSLDQIPVIERPNGAKSWNLLHGVLATGEAIALHESLQPAGMAPNPPHAVQHSEFIFVREGTLLFEHNGNSEKVGAGGVIFVAFGTMHSARNIGDGPAKYLVVAIGGDTR